MALKEGLTYEWDQVKRDPNASKSMTFINRITEALSKKMLRKVRNRYGVAGWPWDREGFRRTPSKIASISPASLDRS